MDVVGGVLLEDGPECKVLTGVDDHSRCCVCSGIMVRGQPVPSAVSSPRPSSATRFPRKFSLIFRLTPPSNPQFLRPEA